MARIGMTYHPPKRDPFDADAYLEEVEEAVEELGEEMKEDFEDVVSDWQTDVTFRKEVRVESGGIVVFIGPASNAKIWHYVDKGTRPHIIRPKNGRGLLIFQEGYSARTQPGRAHVGTGTASGEWRGEPIVHHPGTEAREFTKTIYDKFKPELSRVVRQAIKDAK